METTEDEEEYRANYGFQKNESTLNSYLLGIL
jgi:hypothetical protein